jgi:hypothetical protein
MALRTGYGTGVYTSGKYGVPEAYEGASASSITLVVSEADGQRIALGAASVEDAVSHVVTGQRVQSASVSASISASATAAGFTAVAASAATTIETSVALYWNRVRPFSASDASQSDNVINARYKWINTSVAPVTWTDADYREGAA